MPVSTAVLHPCPICGKECINYYRDVLDGWCLMEEGWQCAEGHYSYTYATGAHQEIIGNREFVWSYTTKRARLQRMEKLIAKQIEKEKKKYGQTL